MMNIRRKRQKKGIYPIDLYQKDPKEIAYFFAKRSGRFISALNRLLAYWEGRGYCNRASKNFSFEMCNKLDKIIDELNYLYMSPRGLKKIKESNSPFKEPAIKDDNFLLFTDEQPKGKEKKFFPYGFPGTLFFLANIRRTFQSPQLLANLIWHMSTYPGDQEIKQNIQLVKAQFSAIFNTIVQIIGICEPESPFFDPKICKRLSEIQRAAWIHFNEKVRRKFGLKANYTEEEGVDEI